MKIPDLVSLAELTYFRFQGGTNSVEELVARLDTPSLQEFHPSLRHDREEVLHIPHLLKFIRKVDIRFRSAQLKFWQSFYTISLLTQPHSIGVPSFGIRGNELSSISNMYGALSAMLVTVEEVFIVSYPSMHTASSFMGLLGFFQQLRHVKILRVQHGLEELVANQLQNGSMQHTENPLPVPEEAVTIPSTVPVNSSQSNLGILPSLEQIEIHTMSLDAPNLESGIASGLKSFEFFVTARQQAGCVVKVSYNTEQVLPRSLEAVDEAVHPTLFDDVDGLW
jgi:hypothetical protein